MKRSLIALLTDFGVKDFFVPSLKAVIARINPEAGVIDISHEVPSFDVRAASFILSSCYAFFPRRTVFLAVVDPGVATARKILLVETEQFFFIAPDNGLLTLPLRNEEIVSLTEVSDSRFWLTSETSTFEARDRMAPAAAWLTLGVPPSEFGPPVKRIKSLRLQEPARRRSEIVGAVLYQDKFGNLMTNIPRDLFCSLRPSRSKPRLVLWLGRKKIDRLVTSYAEVKDGRPFFLINSQGLVEIAVREGSASEMLGAKPGQPIRLRLER
jgi:S-adenosylmethionine hydrolase